MKDHLSSEVIILTNKYILILCLVPVIYNSYILPNGITEDANFLRHMFSATLLEALGIKDDSGIIYELINYRYFEDSMLGDWDLMIDGMVNVSNNCLVAIVSLLLLFSACWYFLHQGLNLRVHEV